MDGGDWELINSIRELVNFIESFFVLFMPSNGDISPAGWFFAIWLIIPVS